MTKQIRQKIDSEIPLIPFNIMVLIFLQRKLSGKFGYMVEKFEKGHILYIW